MGFWGFGVLGFWAKFCHTSSSLVPELPILSNFDDQKTKKNKEKQQKNDNYMDTTAMRMENERTFQVFRIFPKISNFSPGIELILGNIAHLVHILTT